jgi:hypothetical protein
MYVCMYVCMYVRMCVYAGGLVAKRIDCCLVRWNDGKTGFG